MNGPWEYRLSEKNVLLLDMAKYQIDDGEVCEKKKYSELTIISERNWGFRSEPIVFSARLTAGENTYPHTVKLYFEIESEVDVDEAELAFEGMELLCSGIVKLLQEKATAIS